jgi:hypothetical protein
MMQRSQVKRLSTKSGVHLDESQELELQPEEIYFLIEPRLAHHEGRFGLLHHVPPRSSAVPHTDS